MSRKRPTISLSKMTYITLREGRCRKTVRVDELVAGVAGYLAIDFDASGRILGVEYDVNHLSMDEQ